MEAIFSWRRANATDLPECLKLRPAKNGAEFVGEEQVLEVWRTLLDLTYATRSAVIERHGQRKPEIVGFGLAVFVKESFAESELRDPTPGLNARIIESVAKGASVVATFREVRDANTRGALQQVILDTSWKNRCLSHSEVDQVRIILAQAYQQLFAGYAFARILYELVDELDFWSVHNQTNFKIVDRFESYRKTNPNNIWNAERALTVVNAETISTDPHSIAAPLFRRRSQPQFGFTNGEQQLLEAALDGLDDESASRTLFVSVAAVKRRWASIFERIAALRPDLCPPNADGMRGVQKRQRIITYIRNHPEELRPFDLSKSNLVYNVARAGAMSNSDR